jgi:hypothetical protein
MNRLPLLSIALLFGLGNTAPADEKPKKGDLAKLQGTWTGKTGLDGCFQTTFIFNGDLCFFDKDKANVDQGATASARAKAPPSEVEGFYRVKWGYADEFLRPYKKNQLPVVKRLRDEGRLLRIEVEKPRYHAAEGSRWDYRVRLTFLDADAAHDPSYEEEVKKKLFSDQDAYRTEESRRFELLDSHWDVVVDVVDLDTK